MGEASTGYLVPGETEHQASQGRIKYKQITAGERVIKIDGHHTGANVNSITAIKFSLKHDLGIPTVVGTAYAHITLYEHAPFGVYFCAEHAPYEKVSE